jgi:hypothetical protein
MHDRALAGVVSIMSIHIFFSDCGYVDWTVLETALRIVLRISWNQSWNCFATVVLTRGADMASARFRLR